MPKEVVTIIDNRGKQFFEKQTKRNGWEETVLIHINEKDKETIIEISDTGFEIYNILNKNK